MCYHLTKLLLEDVCMSSDSILFANETNANDSSNLPPWPILIVDDDEGTHDITKLALRNFLYEGRPLAFTSVYSAQEAREALHQNDEFTVILLDVVMETENAGLELTKFIRQELLNPYTRIIIRTGQSGQAPEKHVVEHYDINDYKDKTELNADRLNSAMRLAIAQYSQLCSLVKEKNALYEDIALNPITGLNNRFKLNELLQVDSKNKTMILFNIDDFSHINDMYGFEQGNYILKEVSYILKGLENDNRKLFHISSDEFALLISHPTTAEALHIVNVVQNKMLHTSFTHNDLDINISFSIAIVENEEHNILNKADLAIREARTVSKNRLQIYHENMYVTQQISNNIKWFREIKSAIHNDRLVPYFQPIYNNTTQRIEKYECLVRLLKDNEVISPFEFLKVAENTGLLTSITKIMLRKSAAVFSQTHYDFSINISPQDLHNEQFPNIVKDIIDEFSLDPKRIIFEILEDNTLSAMDNSLNILHELQKLGCKIALDDFGARCQNFSNLMNLRLDTIKIDGYFIKTLHEEKSRKMVESMVYFAKNAGYKLVAEYVFNKETQALVEELGIAYSQGYSIGKPLPYILKSDQLEGI